MSNPMPFICYRNVLLIVMLLLPLQPQAAEPFSLGELMHQLSLVEQSEARFTETRTSGLITKSIRIKGKLSYRAPDQLIKHSLQPVDERFEINGDTITIARTVKGKTKERKISLARYPSLSPIVLGLRATLAGDIELLRKYYTVSLEGNQYGWKLELIPHASSKSSKDLIKEIIIQGSKSEIRRVQINEANGDQSVMRITRL